MGAVLLDTHALLWFVFDDPRLSAPGADVIADPKVTKVLSVVSLWEIAVKLSIDKLRLGLDFSQFIDSQVTGRDIELLEIRVSHLTGYVALPMHHRDPFDRLLVAQALAESLPVVTADERFGVYGVNTVW